MKVVLLILPLLTASYAAHKGQMIVSPMSPNMAQLKMEIPKATWEPIFFRLINKRAKVAKLNDLRSTEFANNNDLEIRVWMGFGITTLKGYVIKRDGGQWSALKIPGIRPQDPRSRVNVSLTPKSGWEQLWNSLQSEGILTLPDSSQLPGGEYFTDGISYVVEINMNKSYRTYMYGSPEIQPQPEARRMTRIAQILNDEFATDSH